MAAPIVVGVSDAQSTILADDGLGDEGAPAPPGREWWRRTHPVTVHWEVGVRCPPYSSGKRNCRSAEQKWEEVTDATRSQKPPSIKELAIIRPSTIVEQAPKMPRKGISNSRRP
jgi:hypothetical protein